MVGFRLPFATQITIAALLLNLIAYQLLRFKLSIFNNTVSSNQVLTGDIYEDGHEISHPELCPSLGAKLKLIIFVASAPSHFTARSAIRLTWGLYSKQSDISIAFIFGAPPDTYRPLIYAEDIVNGDIIIGRFIDSYSNLTLKTLSILEWVNKFCPLVPKVLKTDDDVFINIPRLMSFIKSRYRIKAKKTIWGELLSNSVPSRENTSKYFLSPQQFPGDVVPKYLKGASYLLTTNGMKDMLAAALAEPYVRLEDVFITGVLASKLGIKRIDTREFHSRIAQHPCDVIRNIAVSSDDNINKQFYYWRTLLKGLTKCRNFKKLN